MGVFALHGFAVGERVLEGVIEAELDRNDAHASQIGEHRFVRHSGLMPLVNHSCDPSCGIAVNPDGAHDLIARHAIAEGEEITFDYAMRNHTIDHFPRTAGAAPPTAVTPSPAGRTCPASAGTPTAA